MKAAVGILTFSIVAAACVGQTTGGSPEKPARKNVQRSRSSFVCPDTEAQKACKSYEELLIAKDTGLPAHGYVCFRKERDDVFTVSFSKPHFQTHWDQQLKERVTDADQTSPGWGLAQTYRDGVQDSGVMPSVVYGGKWTPYGNNSGVFISDKINFKPQDENDKDVGISIDDSQLSITYKYQNKFDKTVTYSLTIQRSTGRFSEYFQSESEKVPFEQGAGRCISRGAP